MEKLTKSDVLYIESQIFAATRYYIGRHTIAASAAAGETAAFINSHKEIFTNQRAKENFAADIRSSINRQLSFYANIELATHTTNFDVFAALCEYIKGMLKQGGKIIDPHGDHPGDPGYLFPGDYKFCIDQYAGRPIVTSYELKCPRVENFDIESLMVDLNPWSKLAGWLDPKLLVFYKYEDTVKEEPGFSFATISRLQGQNTPSFDVHLTTQEAYIQNPAVDRYIDESYITAVEPY